MRLNFKDLILYEDDHFLAANKPPYMATLEDRNDPTNLQALAKRYNPSLSACHRLDKETSGVVLMAKSEEAYRHASIQFESRQIEKIYHAVVDGLHKFENEEVNMPILALAMGIVKIDLKMGKPSKTTFNTLELFRNHSLIECRPLTGRMHQIRIHLSRRNAPIVNDTLYGGETFYLSSLKKNYRVKKDTEERPLIKRFALHAKSLTFDNFSEKISVEADYPKDISVLIKQLRKYAS